MITWTIKNAAGETLATIYASHDDIQQLTIHHDQRADAFAGLQFDRDGVVLGHWDDNEQWEPLADVC